MQRHFNHHLSRIRISSEHAIGLLKGRFQSLRELHIQINSQNQFDFAIIWIRVCFILHNFIIDIEGDSHDDMNAEWERNSDYGLRNDEEDVAIHGDDSEVVPSPHDPRDNLVVALCRVYPL